VARTFSEFLESLIVYETESAEESLAELKKNFKPAPWDTEIVPNLQKTYRCNGQDHLPEGWDIP
jgi:hypothetical protein